MKLYFKSKGRLVRVESNETNYGSAVIAVTVAAFNQRMKIDGAILASVPTQGKTK